MGELIRPPVGILSLDEVDPVVRGYLRDATHQLTHNPLAPNRFGKAPVPTAEQFLSARKVGLESMRSIAEKMPESDELLVDIDRVPGGLMIPFIAMTVIGRRDLFHPDRTIITAEQFKEYAERVYRLMKTGKNSDDLAVVFFRRNKRPS